MEMTTHRRLQSATGPATFIGRFNTQQCLTSSELVHILDTGQLGQPYLQISPRGYGDFGRKSQFFTPLFNALAEEVPIGIL